MLELIKKYFGSWPILEQGKSSSPANQVFWTTLSSPLNQVLLPSIHQPTHPKMFSQAC
jgi:hypothetical protein